MNLFHALLVKLAYRGCKPEEPRRPCPIEELEGDLPSGPIPLAGRRTLLVAPPGSGATLFIACLVEQEITAGRDVMVVGEEAPKMLPASLLDKATVLDLGPRPIDWKRLVDACLTQNPSLLLFWDAWSLPAEERDRLYQGKEGVQIWHTLNFSDFPCAMFDSWYFLAPDWSSSGVSPLGTSASRAIAALRRPPRQRQGSKECVTVTRAQAEGFDVDARCVPIPSRVRQWLEAREALRRQNVTT